MNAANSNTLKVAAIVLFFLFSPLMMLFMLVAQRTAGVAPTSEKTLSASPLQSRFPHSQVRSLRIHSKSPERASHLMK